MILETFFLTEEKRLISTQNFREKQNFHDLFPEGAPADG
jgi:hypothetical protein